MSGYIPFEIQVEIIERISDVTSLIKFRLVSKPWKSLIDSPKFIVDYHTRHHNHRLLCEVDAESHVTYVSIVDNDDSFPQQQHKISEPIPMYVNLHTLESFKNTRNKMSATSQGLVCLYDGYENPPKIVVLWNPAIRKSVHIVVPDVLLRSQLYRTVIGFGVSPHTNDPMLLKIISITRMNSDTTTCIPRQVEVFTLSIGGWRSLRTNLPRKSIEFSCYNVVIDRFIYWISHDWYAVDSVNGFRNMIMSFDMTSEEFTEISLPDYLAGLKLYSLGISKLGESLVVLETITFEKTKKQVVWIMEHGVPNSFRKLFTIKAPDASIREVYGFRKSGEPIIERFFNIDTRYVTSVYEPSSQRFNNIVISKYGYLYSLSSYTETLLLLDH